MKEMNINDLNQVIQLNKNEAERIILQQKNGIDRQEPDHGIQMRSKY